MSSSPVLPPPPLAGAPRHPHQRTVVGFGGVCLDTLAVVVTFPQPDEKTRARNTKVQGGGDAANALTCVARLGLNARLISKIGDDAHGRNIVEELNCDGVDTSCLVVAKDGQTPSSYVIVDQATRTRTCIFTPGSAIMEPDDISPLQISAVEGASFVYFDGRLTIPALKVAQEAASRRIPILLDAEKKRTGLDDILRLSDYVVCAKKFPQAWTEAPSLPSALVYMLLELRRLKFVIVTLGEQGCIMLERSSDENSLMEGGGEEEDVDILLSLLKEKKDDSATRPACFPSKVMKLKAKGIGTVTGRLLFGTAERIPPSEVVDTTGAGDAFIGATLYALCMNMPAEKMLPFAATVAASVCKELGARTGLPHRTDPLLAPFMGQNGYTVKPAKKAFDEASGSNIDIVSAMNTLSMFH